MGAIRKFFVENNHRYGRLIAVEEVKVDKDPSHRYHRCICDCGNDTIVRDDFLCKGITKSCGCLWNDTLSEYQKNNSKSSSLPIGYKSGLLTVIEDLGIISIGNKREHCYKCKCACGNELTIRQYSLKKVGQKSCGCIKSMKVDKYIPNIQEQNNKYIYPSWFIDDLYLKEDKIAAINGTLNVSKKVKFKCKEGHIYDQVIYNHINTKTKEPKCGCRFCKQIYMNKCRSELCKKKRRYPQWFIDELYDNEDKKKAINGELKTTEKVRFKCLDCGEVYIQRISHHINLSTQSPLRKCPKCRYVKSSSKHKDYYKELRVYPQWFIDKLVDIDDKNRCIAGELKSKDFVFLRCNKGHVYRQQVSSAIHLFTGEEYEGCPKCACYRSKDELDIESFVHSLGFKTEHKRGLFDETRGEVDIYIPEKSIAIEYNGSFWHKTLPKDTFSKDIFYHQNKFNLCFSKGIHLISIFDVDYSKNKEKIHRYLMDLLCDKKTICARKCVIKEVSFNIANSFYDKYHLLGKTNLITKTYGVFYNNELFSCMSFQKGRYKENKKSVWCLTRFVTKSGYTIIGGASKLLHQFEKEHIPDVLFSYSDNDYFTGGVYERLGFECIGYSRFPRYYWFLNKKEIKRESCQLKILCKKYPDLYEESLAVDGNKENYIMEQLGAMKVYRSGSKKWIKRYNYKNKEL